MDQTGSDEEIVAQVLAGKRSRYRLLVERYQHQVYNLMYRYCHSEHDAADLTQDVFLKAFEKLGSYQSGRSFFSWLYTLAMNRARDWRRRQLRWTEQEWCESGRIEELASSSLQEKEFEQQDDIRRLERAMAQLPDNVREILLLRYRQERSIRELAHIFSLTESAVKMRISRGIERLQLLLQGGKDDKTEQI